MRLMRLLAVSAVACFGLIAPLAPASALSPGAVAPLAKAAPSNVVQADYYCGPGWYLDRWGYCRPYGYGYGYGWYGYGYPYYRYRHYGHNHYRYKNYGYRNYGLHGISSTMTTVMVARPWRQQFQELQPRQWRHQPLRPQLRRS